MKLTPVLSLLLVTSIFLSCEKESLKEPVSFSENSIENRNLLFTSSEDPIEIQDGIILQNGRLSFQDEATFENFMFYLATIDVGVFLEELSSYGYRSFSQYAEIKIGEPELGAVLNENGAIAVNNFVIKLNFLQEEAYVIPDTASPLAIYRTETAENSSGLPYGANVVPFNEDIFEFING